MAAEPMNQVRSSRREMIQRAAAGAGMPEKFGVRTAELMLAQSIGGERVFLHGAFPLRESRLLTNTGLRRIFRLRNEVRKEAIWTIHLFRYRGRRSSGLFTSSWDRERPDPPNRLREKRVVMASTLDLRRSAVHRRPFNFEAALKGRLPPRLAAPPFI